MSGALNEVLLRRNDLIYLPEVPLDDRIHFNDVVKAVQFLFGYGFRLDKAATVALCHTSKLAADELVDCVKSWMKVADWKPFYENFPASVKERSDYELYVNALFHYLGDVFGVRIMPYELKLPRPALDVSLVRTFSSAPREKVAELTANLLAQGQPFSQTDRSDVITLKEFVVSMNVPIRENLAFLAAQFPELAFVDQLDRAGDVLRYAAELSNAGPSVPSPKFKLTRANRRRVAAVLWRVLENSSALDEDVARDAELWKRLVKEAHFGELGLGPRGTDFLNALYHGAYQSRASKLEGHIICIERSNILRLFSRASKIEERQRNAQVDVLLKLYSERPGIFARDLAMLLRKLELADERKRVVAAFTKITPRVSQRVLIQMWNLFKLPVSSELPLRSFAGKCRSGNRAFLENRLDGDYSDVFEALKIGFQGRNSRIKVSVDPREAESYVIPLGVRSASPGMRVIGRGSRIALDSKTKALRFFMYWRDIPSPHSRVDLDLSAMFVNETLTQSTDIAFYNLKNNDVEAFHSGDITSAPSGAAEFLDINVEKALSAGYRYVVTSVHSYRGQPFARIPEAWAGVMERDDVNSGEIFEVSTVSMRYDLTSQSQAMVPFMFDLQTREMIWLDSPLESGATLRGSWKKFRVLVSEVLSRPMTVADLLKLTSAELVSADDPDAIHLDPKDASQVLNLINS